MLKQDKKLIESNIEFDDVDIDKFHKCLVPELKSLNAKRFNYKIQKQKNKIKFVIKADDKTAEKAAHSAINKLHIVYKKMMVFDDGGRSFKRKNTRTSDA